MVFNVPHLQDEGDGGASPVQDSPEIGGGSGQDTNQDACQPGQIKDDNDNCIDPPEEEECPEGFKKNAKGKCVTDICDEINAQLNDEDYTNKLDELIESVNPTDEIGYAFDISIGEYVSMQTNSNMYYNSVSTKGLNLNYIVGYVHSHTCNPSSGGYAEFTAQVPSPKDIKAFLVLLNRASLAGRSLQDVFLTVVSCSEGITTLKYTGTQSDINQGFSSGRRTYIRYIEEYKGNENLALMKYLEEVVKMPGIEVVKYSLNDDGILEANTLQINESSNGVNTINNCN